MKAARVLRAALLAALFTLPLRALWLLAPYDEIGAPTVAAWPLERVLTLAVFAAALAGLLQRRASPLPWLAAMAAGAEIVVLYPYATIDWTRLLKDWGLVDAGAPPAAALALAAVPFAVAFVAHAADHADRLEARLTAKSVPVAEREVARALLRRRATLALLAGIAGLAALEVGFLVLSPLARGLGSGALTFAAPVLAAVVLAGLALAYLARREGARDVD